MDVKGWSGLRIRTGEVIQRSIKTLCNFNHGGSFTGHYRFKKDFYGLSDIPTVFHEHIDKVLEFKTPVWLDDIICVTHGTAEEHERELRDILPKLQDTGYRASEKKKLTWLGSYHIDQNGVNRSKKKQNL